MATPKKQKFEPFDLIYALETAADNIADEGDSSDPAQKEANLEAARLISQMALRRRRKAGMA